MIKVIVTFILGGWFGAYGYYLIAVGKYQTFNTMYDKTCEDYQKMLNTTVEYSKRLVQENTTLMEENEKLKKEIGI